MSMTELVVGEAVGPGSGVRVADGAWWGDMESGWGRRTSGRWSWQGMGGGGDAVWTWG